MNEEQDTQEAARVDNGFLESSLTVLELAQSASQYFQEASEPKKQKILNLVLSNLQLKSDKLVYKLREPFDILLNASKTQEWLPRSDSNRRPIG